MAIGHLKLWHILPDRQMKKRDLQRQAGLSGGQRQRLDIDAD